MILIPKYLPNGRIYHVNKVGPIWGKRTVGNETTSSSPFLIESKFFYMVVGDAVRMTDGWPADVATMPYMVFVCHRLYLINERSLLLRSCDLNVCTVADYLSWLPVNCNDCGMTGTTTRNIMYEQYLAQLLLLDLLKKSAENFEITGFCNLIN